MKQTLTRGFTLIELLVVIAIIGILASVVLASLNSARDKGADSAAKANLANMRAQAELFYDNQSPNTYDAVCADSNMTDAVTSAASAQGATYTAGDTTVPSATVAACHDSAAGWAAQVPLNSGTSFCVDSTGVAEESASFLAASAVACP